MDWVFSWQNAFIKREKTILVKVLSVHGSAPCRSGDVMVIARHNHSYGTIGGGNLELSATRQAEKLLLKAKRCILIEEFSLSVSFNQCCGGSVVLQFEYIDFSLFSQQQHLDAKDFFNTLLEQQEQVVLVSVYEKQQPKIQHEGILDWIDTVCCNLVTGNCLSLLGEIDKANLRDIKQRAEDCCLGENSIQQATGLIINNKEVSLSVQRLVSYKSCLVFYGAGHITQKCLSILQSFPWKFVIVDDRNQCIQRCKAILNVENQAKFRWLEKISAVSDKLHPIREHLIISYSHDIDFFLCNQLLNLKESVSMIGSKTKAKRFKHRLRKVLNFSNQEEALNSPIGYQTEHIKSPEAVAISISHFLVKRIDARQQQLSNQNSLSQII